MAINKAGVRRRSEKHLALSPFEQDEEHFLMGAEIFHCGAAGANLPAQDVVEDLTHVLLPLHTRWQKRLGLETRTSREGQMNVDVYVNAANK